MIRPLPLIPFRLPSRCSLIVLAAAVSVGLASRPAASAASLEYHFNIWDWTVVYKDLAQFERRVRWAKSTGFTLIEITSPWRVCEPQQGRFDFTELDKRLAIIQETGLDIRIRVNLYHSNGWPTWLQPVFLEDPAGKKIAGILTFLDPAINKKADRSLAALVRHLAGRRIRYSPFFGMHAEIKFGAWLGYGPSGRAAWRAWLKRRFTSPQKLARRWGRPVKTIDRITPPIMPETTGTPDLNSERLDWIAFREDVLARRVQRFAGIVRANDSSAKVSVPLGEGVRRGAAEMANLAYARYARHADEVVHSFDFFMHAAGDPATAAAVSTSIFIGTTRRPVFLEIDGPIINRDFGYTEKKLIDIAKAALDAGATGFQIANYSYEDFPDDKYPFLNMAALGFLFPSSSPASTFV